MLSLYASQQFTDVDDNDTVYTIYKDDKDENRFYAIPNAPRFVGTEKHDPTFRFIAYRNDSADDDSKGGFCVFSTAMDISRLSLPDVKAKLFEQLLSSDSAIVKVMNERASDTLAMCVASKSKNTDRYQQLRQKLGYSDTEAQNLVAEYESGKKTKASDFLVLPAQASDILLSPVTFTDASVNLNIAGSDDGKMVERVTSSKSPDLTSNHNATFSTELSKDGAGLFEQALKEGNSGIVAVSYDAKFEARLPPATVTVTYNSKQTAEYTRKVSRDTWGHEDKVKQAREQALTENSKVDVDMGSVVGLDEQQQQKLHDSLQKWGEDQLVDILNSKTTLDLTDLTTNADKYDDFQNQLEAVNDFTRVYSESRTVIFSNTFTAQLPTIRSVIGPEGDISKYFEQINTDTTFFKDLDLRASVNTLWGKDSGITSVNLTLFYGEGIKALKQDVDSKKITVSDNGQLPSSFDVNSGPYNLDAAGMVFDDSIAPAQLPLEKTWPMQALDANQKQGIRNYVYQYQVNYDPSLGGADLQYKSPFFYTSEPVLTLAVANQTLQVNVSGQNNVNWNFIKSAQVDLTYKDANHPSADQNFVLSLTEQAPTASAIKPLGTTRTNPLSYAVTYQMDDGGKLPVNRTKVNQTGRISVNIQDPFTGTRSLRLMPTWSDAVDFIGITATYTITELGYSTSKDFTFEDKSTQVWDVPDLKKPGAATSEGVMTYSGKIRSNGEMQDISGSDDGTNFVTVGLPGMHPVDIMSLNIDFDTYDMVTAYMKKGDDETSFQFFSANDPDGSWSYKGDKGYQWRIEALDKSGKTIYAPGPDNTTWGSDSEARFPTFIKLKQAAQ